MNKFSTWRKIKKHSIGPSILIDAAFRARRISVKDHDVQPILDWVQEDNKISILRNKEEADEDQRKEDKSALFQEEDLVLVTPTQLELPNGASRSEVYSQASRFGLVFLTGLTGIELRVQYDDQPNGENLYIGMKVLLDKKGHPRILQLGHDDGYYWIKAPLFPYNRLFQPDDKIVFGQAPEHIIGV